jgi:hypothetical protein
MEYLGWNSTGKAFYLLDTFKGLNSKYVSAQELAMGYMNGSQRHLESGFYTQDVEKVLANFSEWNNVHIIVGPVPETLSEVKSTKVAYLHLDMNCTPPEVAALNFFWDNLVPGALILLDDYAYRGYEPQKAGLDEVAREKNIKILSLPTGQGLALKP